MAVGTSARERRIRATTPVVAVAVPARVGARPFAAAIALSSGALFALELLAGQVVLPAFGGSPAVWATALAFFTAVLFAGYLYAHLLITRLPLRAGIGVHLAVAAVAAAATVVAPGRATDLVVTDLPTALNVVLALGAIAGGAAFLFSTTTPLVSAWYAQAVAARAAGRRVPGASGASSPAASSPAPGSDRGAFWLYAASNGASLGVVLAYPFLIQPFIGLAAQRALLIAAALGFLLLLVLAATRVLAATSAGGARTAAAESRSAAGAASDATSVAADRVDRRRQLRWLAAAFVPAGLLSATTTYLTTDLISAPVLWIWPLAIYLLSFVIAFSERGRTVLARVERLVPAAATLLWVPSLIFGSWPPLPILLVILSSYLVLAVAIHGRLAADRPAERHLTRFYLVLSAGGVLATAFVGLIAPLVFQGVYEYPLLILAALLVLAVFPAPDGGATWPGARRLRPVLVTATVRVAPYAALAVVFLALVSSLGEQAFRVAGLLVAGSVVIVAAWSYRALAALAAVTIVVGMQVVGTNPMFQERTFFGVLRIVSTDAGAAKGEYSGTTLHGTQFTDDRRTIPTSYYVKAGPLGDVFDDLAHRTASASIGVMGLGAGTIASYERPTDTMTFFEIDPAVADIARDPRWFTYLSDAPVAPSIVIGDGRISLERWAPASFDVLILDAFSSDTVPAHLLTREAIATYRRVMRPGGLIVFHVSNRSYDLAPAIVSTAQSMGIAARQLAYAPGPARIRAEGADASDWVIVGDLDAMTRFAARGWGTSRPGPVLTDDFSDVLRLLNGLPF